jgi:uncharacterized protein (DUF779 family)
MKLSKRSIISGKINEMNLDITEEQYFSWKNGELVQKVFPQLNSGEREFIVSGITPKEWKEVFGEEV